MQGKITRISVTWAEDTNRGRRFRFYNVLPDDEKIIRAERIEDLLDDLTLICEQLQAAHDARADSAASAHFGRALRGIK
jgi:hypothetical protein